MSAGQYFTWSVPSSALCKSATSLRASVGKRLPIANSGITYTNNTPRVSLTLQRKSGSSWVNVQTGVALIFRKNGANSLSYSFPLVNRPYGEYRVRFTFDFFKSGGGEVYETYYSRSVSYGQVC